MRLILFGRVTFYYRPTLHVRFLVHVTIYRGLLIGRDGHLDQSEVYDIS